MVGMEGRVDIWQWRCGIALEKAADGGDSIPPADDKGDNIGREQEEEDAVSSASLDEYTSESEGEMSSENSADHPTVGYS